MAGFNDDVVFAQQGMRIGDETISSSEQASIQFDEPSEDVALLIANTSDDAASSAYEEIKLNSVNSGESFTRYRAGDTCSYALGFLADDSTPTFRLTFNNNGDSSPNNRTMTPWRISNINPGADTMEMVVKSFMTVASEGSGTALFQVNGNLEVGTNAVILLNQFNGTDDTYIHHGGGNGSNWRYGTYATDSSNFYMTNASVAGWPPTAASTTGVITQDGHYTFPKTACFAAFTTNAQNNVTGDGNDYTVIFDNEEFDQNGDYNSTSGIFTAPVDGNYLFVSNVAVFSITSSMTTGSSSIATSNGGSLGLYCSPAACDANNTTLGLGAHTIRQLDALDTAFVSVLFENGASNSADITTGGSATHFSGMLVC